MPLRALLRNILNNIRIPWWRYAEKEENMADSQDHVLSQLMATPPQRSVQHINDDSPEGVTEFHDVTFKQDYIVLDVETTGFNLNTCRIIQLAMIRVSHNGNVDTFSKYFNPCVSREVQLKAYKVHKISPDILLHKKTFKHHCDDIVDFMAGAKYLIGHNVMFDWNFLEKEIRQASGGKLPELLNCDDVVLIDTYKSCLVSFPSLPSFSLGNVAKHLKIEATRQPVMKYRLTSPTKNKKELIEVTENADESLHDALTDTMITKEVFTACVEKLVGDWKSLCLDSLVESRPELVYSVKDIRLMDKLRLKTIDTTEKDRLKQFADTFMGPVSSIRGKLLKDVNQGQIVNTIQFYDNSTRNQINDMRARALLDFYVSYDELAVDDVGENGFGNFEHKKRKDSTLDDYFQQKKPRVEENELKKMNVENVTDEEKKTPVE